MIRLAFLVEEPSMKDLLEAILPRMGMGVEFDVFPFQGKTDLEKKAPERPRLFDDLAQAAGLRADPSELVYRYDFALADANDAFGEPDYGMPIGL